MRLRRLEPSGPHATAYATATVDSGGTPWRQARWCVVDLELTGLDPRRDEIISFGCVPVEGGRALVGRACYGLVRPTVESSEASILVHGIRAVDLLEAPAPPEALATMLEAMTGRLLVAHSGSVERAFLGAALRALGLRLRAPIVDTEILGRLLMAERGEPVPPSLPLGRLASYLGLPQHRAHHALGDALTTAQAFLALATHLEETGTATVETLARAPDRLRWLRG